MGNDAKKDMITYPRTNAESAEGETQLRFCESNVSAPGCSSHGQNKSSNRYHFKTTAHLPFTTLMAFAEMLPETADGDVCY